MLGMRPLEELELELRKDPAYRHALRDIEAEDEFIAKLVAAREAAGLSQAELAKRMGTSQPAVSRLESGSGDPRFSTVARWTQALELNFLPMAVKPTEVSVSLAGRAPTKPGKPLVCVESTQDQDYRPPVPPSGGRRVHCETDALAA